MIVSVKMRVLQQDGYHLDDSYVAVEVPLVTYAVDVINDGEVVWARLFSDRREAEAVLDAVSADIRAQLPDALPFIGPNTRGRRPPPPADG